MNGITLTPAPQSRWLTFVNAYAVWIFVVLTVLLTTLVILLPLPALVGPALVVFIPTLLAILLIRLTEGKGQVRAQLFSARAWSTNWKWVGISIALGVGLRLGVSLIGMLMVPGYQIQPSTLTPLLLVTLILAAGEELGWRGFALPRALKSGASPLKAAFLLGIPWGLLHLPLTLPGKLAEGVPALAQFLVILSLSVITTWLWIGCKGKVLPAVLAHGGQNATSVINNGLPLILNNWLMAAVYGLVAIAIIVGTRGRLGETGQRLEGDITSEKSLKRAS